MPLGIHTREPPRLAVALVVSVVLAALAAVWSLYKIGLVPPSLTPRAVEMGAASTEVVVDTPDTTILDLRQGTSNIESLNNRALLLGNVMASLPVRAYIGRRAHVAPMPFASPLRSRRIFLGRLRSPVTRSTRPIS